MIPDYKNLFPFLEQLDRAAREEFNAVATRIALPPASFICSEGEFCAQVPLLLSGSARVYKTSETGREITLYRIEPGESCILTASCVLSGARFPAFAASEERVETLVVPSQVFSGWVNRYTPWREFVFSLLSKRFASMIEVVEEIAFQRLDARVASWLVDATDSDGLVRVTHEKIAFELGSSREVISRVLKEFEHEGLVRLSRGTIHLLAPVRLADRVSVKTPL